VTRLPSIGARGLCRYLASAAYISLCRAPRRERSGRGRLHHDKHATVYRGALVLAAALLWINDLSGVVASVLGVQHVFGELRQALVRRCDELHVGRVRRPGGGATLTSSRAFLSPAIDGVAYMVASPRQCLKPTCREML
jgi:hypothetical protein